MALNPRCIAVLLLTGPKTTHFWGPVANWGFVLAVSSSSFQQLVPTAVVAAYVQYLSAYTSTTAICAAFTRDTDSWLRCDSQGLADMKKTPDVISPNMTSGGHCCCSKHHSMECCSAHLLQQ
jgi:hypothetical protein